MTEAYFYKTKVVLAMRASIDFFIDVFSSMQVFQNILLVFLNQGRKKWNFIIL